MKLAKFIGSALVALTISAPAIAQQSPGGQPDQVAQLPRQFHVDAQDRPGN